MKCSDCENEINEHDVIYDGLCNECRKKRIEERKEITKEEWFEETKTGLSNFEEKLAEQDHELMLMRDYLDTLTKSLQAEVLQVGETLGLLKKEVHLLDRRVTFLEEKEKSKQS